MKKNKFLLLLFLIFSAAHHTFILSFEADAIGFDELDELSESASTDYGKEIATLMHQTRAPGCEATTQDLVDFAVSLNIPYFEQFNAYKFTNPPVIRNLHDLPSLRPWYGCTDKLCFYATFFYNQMYHAYFSKCGTYISDYLFVDEDDDIIGELEDLIPNIPTIIPLFNTARLQMRRAGGMLGVSKCFGNWRLNAAAPLYYLEFNFFLTPQQVDALNAAPFFGGDQPVPVSDDDQNVGFSIFDPNTFINRYLVSDKIGLGDIRIYLDYMFASESWYPTRVGGQITLPNSSIMRSSISGNSFNKCSPGPGLDFSLLAELQCIALGDPTDPLTQDAKNQLAILTQGYAVQFLERLSATVLENSLGQRQASYGFLAETSLAVTNNTNICLFFEWDQFMQGSEDRPVRLVITPSQSLDRNYTDEAQAQDNLTFLQQRANNILWPIITPLKVKQGDIIKARIYSQTNWETFQWDIGYDFWTQGKEIAFICNTCITPYAQLDVKSAARPSSLQNKLFGHMNVQKYPEYYENFGWRLGLCAEASVSGYGIGKDWLVGIDFVADF